MNPPPVAAPAATAGLRFALAATVAVGIAAGSALARADGAPQTGEWRATGGAQAPDLERWRLMRHGYGRLNVGLTRDKIERRAGRSLRFVYNTGPCAIWRIRGVRGIWIMTIRGRLARVDLGRRPWRTSLGIRVGTARAKSAIAIHASGPGSTPTIPMATTSSSRAGTDGWCSRRTGKIK
jgi:hypothetical protein